MDKFYLVSKKNKIFKKLKTVQSCRSWVLGIYIQYKVLYVFGFWVLYISRDLTKWKIKKKISLFYRVSVYIQVPRYNYQEVYITHLYDYSTYLQCKSYMIPSSIFFGNVLSVCTLA